MCVCVIFPAAHGTYTVPIFESGNFGRNSISFENFDLIFFVPTFNKRIQKLWCREVTEATGQKSVPVNFFIFTFF